MLIHHMRRLVTATLPHQPRIVRLISCALIFACFPRKTTNFDVSPSLARYSTKLMP